MGDRSTTQVIDHTGHLHNRIVDDWLRIVDNHLSMRASSSYSLKDGGVGSVVGQAIMGGDHWG